MTPRTMSDILVVDDEPVITEAVLRICSSEGYAVDTAGDAPAGIEMAMSRHYRVILCDIMMPGMDGFEFLMHLRRNKNDTPVVMSTGFSTIENAVRSLHDGAIDFVPKPFTTDELLSAVRRAFKYGEILGQVRKSDSSASTGTLHYVPCPPRYSRLGYRSWVVAEHDGTAQLGVTDLFIKTAGDLHSVGLCRINDEIVQGNSCAELQAVDGMSHTVLSPLSGRIVARNERLLDGASLIEKDPYFDGWLYRIIPSDLEYESKHLTSCSSDRI